MELELVPPQDTHQRQAWDEIFSLGSFKAGCSVRPEADTQADMWTQVPAGFKNGGADLTKVLYI